MFSKCPNPSGICDIQYVLKSNGLMAVEIAGTDIKKSLRFLFLLQISDSNQGLETKYKRTANYLTYITGT